MALFCTAAGASSTSRDSFSLGSLSPAPLTTLNEVAAAVVHLQQQLLEVTRDRAMPLTINQIPRAQQESVRSGLHATPKN